MASSSVHFFSSLFPALNEVFGEKRKSKNRRKKRDTKAYCEYHREGKKYARQSRGGRDGRRGEERERFVVGFAREKRSLKRSLRISADEKRKNNGEATLWSAEEEEEKGERRGDKGSCGGYGEVEAWSDGVVDRVGVGCIIRIFLSRT